MEATTKRGGYFSLDQIYKHERQLARMHPGNKHVREKIRQTIQVLRDLGEVEFVDNRGTYQRSK